MSAHFRHKQPEPAPRVRLSVDLDRVIAAIGYIIKEGDRRGDRLTQYDIVKSLFIADRAHLNTFGRPITFDNYVAMKHGPVPSLAYDLLKENKTTLREFEIESLPWSRRAADELGLGCFRFFESTTHDDDEILSPSDMEALSAALTVVTSLSFGQVRKLTHSDLAYKEAWNAVGDGNSNPMSLGLLFDTPDFEAAEDIRFMSHLRAEHETDDSEPPSDSSATDFARW